MPRPENLNSPRQGQAAVHRVVSELMFRGMNVALPCDHGVDLYADSVRVQVKSAYLRDNPQNSLAARTLDLKLTAWIHCDWQQHD